jgi:hypothetical protein
MPYLALNKSYKNKYPFKLATTSFIYPDGYRANVKLLAPFIDEIELLLFESTATSLPAHDTIRTLAGFAKLFDISYNVHLPVDIYLGHASTLIRKKGVDILREVLDRVAPLTPSTHTLHLTHDIQNFDSVSVRRWQDRLVESLTQLLAGGVDSRTISVETLTYPFEWVGGLIRDFNFSVCIDIGHLLLKGFDLASTADKYLARTPIIHLHGIDKKKDHQPLDALAPEMISPIMDILSRFHGVVSIEVFSYSHLKSSLDYLENWWKTHNLSSNKVMQS